jgi:hypothetical protein
MVKRSIQASDSHPAILSANPANFAVLRMFVGNPGNPFDKPILP